MTALRAGRMLLAAALVLVLGVLAWIHLAVPIDLVTADLGRHLSNGREFFTAGRILATNFYSYTVPDFPAPCHHWGAGVLFYSVWKAGGFPGLSLGYAALLCLTFLLTLVHARRRSSGVAVLLAGVLALPLLAYRVEIRPEGISTLLLAAEFFLLEEWRRGRCSGRWLIVLPLFQLFWVNVHILFFCGLLLIAFYVIEAFAKGSFGFRALGAAAGASAAVTFINPFVLSGALQPALIFQGYGYEIAENQSVFFMMKRFPDQPVFAYYLAAFLLVTGLLAGRMWKEKDWRPAFPQFFLVVVIGLIGCKAVRGIAMAGFVFIPVAAGIAGTLQTQFTG